MEGAALPRAVAAGASTAAALGLPVDDAVVLHNSNKLTVRLLPCDVLARVAPAAHHVAQLEVELAQRLGEAGSPVATLDPRVEPRVHERDGFVVTLWTYYDPPPSRDIPPLAYARALARLHAGMRALDITASHFTHRVERALRLLADLHRTPALADADRVLLESTLRTMSLLIVERGAPEQLLHGEPHPGNVLSTADGLLFIDFETSCRGPVEFDLAHAPEAVADHYAHVDAPTIDKDLLRDCRILVLAMTTTWRWDSFDELPHGRQLGLQWLGQLRVALDGH